VPMPPRRSPGAAERRRDPERARERLLDAAAEEFGAKGFAGARVRDIAARAGLNQQLISYYFGGKAGLYQALQRRWVATSHDLGRPGLALEEVVVNFLQAGLANRSWARLLAWQGLADDAGGDGGAPRGTGEQSALMQWIVAEFRRRQDAGELAGDLAPAYVALVLFAAVAAPAVLPHVARELSGLDPDGEEFQRDYSEQLARLVRHLKP
jgi:TetR/AcrR family transcriptional regulator